MFLQSEQTHHKNMIAREQFQLVGDGSRDCNTLYGEHKISNIRSCGQNCQLCCYTPYYVTLEDGYKVGLLTFSPLFSSKGYVTGSIQKTWKIYKGKGHVPLVTRLCYTRSYILIAKRRNKHIQMEALYIKTCGFVF